MQSFIQIILFFVGHGFAAHVPNVSTAQACPEALQQALIGAASGKARQFRMPVGMAYAGPTSQQPGSPQCSFGHVAFPWSSAAAVESVVEANRTVASASGGTCDINVDDRHDCGYNGITADGCTAKGCCWRSNNVPGKPWCYFGSGQPPAPNGQCDVPDNKKADCGFRGVTQPKCEASGCCWQPMSAGSSTPWCFRGKDSPPPPSPSADRSHFLFGSFTKVWTASAVLKLVKDGKVGLDDTAFQYMEPAYHSATGGSLLDIFPEQIKEVTIRNMLWMRANFNDYDELEYQVRHPLEDLGPARTIQLFGRGKMNTNLPQGSCSVYSSISYVLLGLVLNGQSGQAWDVYDQNVWRDQFPEIGFAVHGPCSKYTDIAGDCSDCRRRGHEAKDMSCTGGYTCGNMVGPPEEVARFTRALFSGELLGADLTKQMLDFKPLGPQGAEGINGNACQSFDAGDLYGLGVEGHKQPQFPGHEGVTYGFTALSKYDEGRKAAYTVSIATSNPGMDGMAGDAWGSLWKTVGPWYQDQATTKVVV